MGKLLEVIRRLAVALTWLVGGFFGIGLIVEGWNDVDDPTNEVRRCWCLGCNFHCP